MLRPVTIDRHMMKESSIKIWQLKTQMHLTESQNMKQKKTTELKGETAQQLIVDFSTSLAIKNQTIR